MHRNNLLNLLKDYNPIDEPEITAKSKMIDFILANPNCFERSCMQGHITGSCLLLSRTGKEILLMHHKKLNQWLQLGGHCDGDPDVLSVAIKEAQEESGISSIEPVSLNIFDIDIHTIPATSEAPEHSHFDVRFLLKVTSNEVAVKNHESNALVWFAKNKVPLPLVNKSLQRMLEKWSNM